MSRNRFAVIGHPIGHTMSPFIHDRLFSLSEKKAIYEVFDIPDLSASNGFCSLKSLTGFNITIPHKQTIIPFLDRLDAKAAKFGSVNTVKNENGVLTGYTTDGAGFLKALESSGQSFCCKTLLLGCGGAARALAFELAAQGSELTVAVRPQSLEKAEKMAAEVAGLYPCAKISICTMNKLENLDECYGLLANATPVGMYPHANAMPVTEKVLKNCAAVFDAIYNPDKTLLLKTAAANGSKVMGGMAMLVWQAVAAHEIWDGSHYQTADIEQLCCDSVIEMNRIFTR